MTHNITVESGKSIRLLTSGKYCDRDIIVTATGGGGESIDTLPVPLVLQAKATPTLNAKYKGYIFNPNIYNTTLNGVEHRYWKFGDYEVLESQSNLVVAFDNHTNRPVAFYFYAYNYDEELHGGETTYRVVNVAPNSSTSITIDSYGQQPIWDYELEGMVFY